MKSITATKALYIKLGEGGGLAHDCIENGYLQIRYEGVNHEMCMQGRWEEIKNTFPYGSNASSKTHHRNQVQKEVHQIRRLIICQLNRLADLLNKPHL